MREDQSRDMCRSARYPRRRRPLYENDVAGGMEAVLKPARASLIRICTRWGGKMLPLANRPPRRYCGWLLAAFLQAGSVLAQTPAQAQPPNSAKTAFGPKACGCADGRYFAIGASMFGKNSARVVITGF